MTVECDEGGDEVDWACLSWSDLEADLAECEEIAAPTEPLVLSPQSSTDELRLLVQQSSAAPASDVDALFSAHRALHSIASELQAALVQVETLQFSSASFVASLAYGPLRPPSCTSECSWDGIPPHKLFGPSTVPAPPPPLEFEAPADAKTLVDYQRRLAGMPPALFIERQLRLCVGEVDRYQDAKDIGRDELVVNGMPVSGSTGGYAAAVSMLSGGMEVAMAPAASAETRERAAQLLLGALNRTNSGFIAFEEVLRLLDCPDVVVVSPESAAALPLEATILPGIALGRAHTRYSVRRGDGCGPPLIVVDVTYVFRVAMSTLERLAAASPSSPNSGASESAGTWPAEEVRAAVLICRA